MEKSIICEIEPIFESLKKQIIDKFSVSIKLCTIKYRHPQYDVIEIDSDYSLQEVLNNPNPIFNIQIKTGMVFVNLKQILFNYIKIFSDITITCFISYNWSIKEITEKFLQLYPKTIIQDNIKYRFDIKYDFDVYGISNSMFGELSNAIMAADVMISLVNNKYSKSTTCIGEIAFAMQYLKNQ